MPAITLTEKEFKLVQSKVESGRYADAHEVVQAALELQDEHERYLRLRDELQKAIDQDARGEGTPYSREWFEKVKEEAHQDFLAGKPVKDFVKP